MIEYYSLATTNSEAVMLCSCGNLFQVNNIKDIDKLNTCPECSLNIEKIKVIKEKSVLFDNIIHDIKERRKDE